ncbi:hypothetical protein M8C21_005743 [Ambrosia artemisiifolia]|uniref:Uncharacterized protein n=1 Tax=Ambrosia artemisiifolia TaxID=4212 RepID=A0AAD5GMN5_AMBAR|nr:hypothetical protein M8C21_005743 [Ambrosia artemisiifolia]
MLLHFGSVPTIVVSSAEVAQEILKTHDSSFSSRPSLPITNILLYGSKDIAFSPYGEYWRQLKSIAVVHLLSGTRVKSFRKVREHEISLMTKKLGDSEGSLVDMGLMLSSLLIDIICKVSFGRAYDVSKLMDLSKTWLDLLTVFSVGSYIPWLSWIDRVTGLVGRAEDVAKQMDEFLERVVEDHANMNCDGRKEDGEDLVDILLDIHRDETTGFTLHRDSLKSVILVCFLNIL